MDIQNPKGQIHEIDIEEKGYHQNDDLAERVEVWERLEVQDRRVGRICLTITFTLGWLICLIAALLRFENNGEYAPLVAVLGVLSIAILAYYFGGEKKSKIKR